MITTLTDTEDPQDCPDCIVDGRPCAYHRGWADAWDMCSQVVGALVLDQHPRSN